MPIKNIFVTALTDFWTTTDAPSVADKLGDVRWEGSRAYKCVQFTATSSAAGRAVRYADLAGYVAHQVRETATATELTAGLTTAQVPSANMIGWIQIKGQATPSVAATGVVIGDAIGGSATLAAFGLWVTPDIQLGVCISTTNLVLDCML